MKEIRYIFNGTAILGFIAATILFFASISANSVLAPQLLEFGGAIFIISFASGLVGLLADN